MDITMIFKAKLDVVKNRNKALGTVITSPGSEATSLLQHSTNGVTKGKSKLFPGKKTEYYAKARELIGNISNLREFLVETKAAYLNVDHNSMNLKTELSTSSNEGQTHVLSRSSSWSLLRRTPTPETMTESEKDQVDMSVQKIIQNNQKRIFEFQKLIESKGVEQDHPQLYIHLGNVINSISQYLKEVCGLYTEMKAIRVKRSVDIQNVAKLNVTQHSHHLKVDSNVKPKPKKIHGDTASNSALDQVDKPLTPTPSPLFPEDADPLASIYSEEEYTAEELQIFEEENSLLLDSLRTTSDEVEQIESSVVQIAQLQEIFTEKVLLQDKEISQISNVVIGTTENIKGGNEQLRQAIQQSADFRAWVLFFIIVMSLSLLFLDWYND